MATTQAKEFQAAKQLLSPRRGLNPDGACPVAGDRFSSENRTYTQNSFWILIGTLLIMFPSSGSRYPNTIRFSTSLWTSIALGFEVLLQRSFGRPHYVFRTFRIITMDDPVWQACALGNLEQVNHLFASGRASPYDQTENGSTLLHVCIWAE